MTKKLGALFAILIFVFSIIAGSLYYSMAKQYVSNEVIRSNKQMVQCVSSYYLENQLDDMELAVKNWSESSELIDAAQKQGSAKTVSKVPSTFRSIAEKWQGYMTANQNMKGFYFGSQKNGSLYSVPIDKTIPETYDVRNREWYQGAVGSPGSIYWSRPYTDVGASGDMVLTVSKAVVSNGKVLGAVGLDIRLKQFSKMLKGIYAGEDGYLVILNPSGDVYAHPDSNMLTRNMSSEQWIQYILRGNQGSGSFEKKGSEYIYSYLTLPKTGWKLVGVRPVRWDVVLYQIQNAILVRGLVLGAVAVAIAVIMTRLLMQPLQAMTQTIEKVATGNLDVRMEVVTDDEVGTVATAFNQMLGALQHLAVEREDHMETLTAQNREMNRQSDEIHHLYEIAESMNRELRQMVENTREGYLQTVRALANAIEASDHYTRGHCDRVGIYAKRLGEKAGFSERQLELLSLSSVLHDIGKIGIPNEILHKPGKLTREEYECIKKHPTIGAEIVAGIPFLAECREIFLQHHERIDGNGYPAMLSKDLIRAEARVMAIADSYDAMTSHRPYREKPMDVETAIGELERGKNTQFDAHLTDLFIKMVRKETEMFIEENASGKDVNMHYMTSAAEII